MVNPFKRSGDPYGRKKRITPEGEPLEGTGRSRSIVRIVVPIIVGIIIIPIMTGMIILTMDLDSPEPSSGSPSGVILFFLP